MTLILPYWRRRWRAENHAGQAELLPCPCRAGRKQIDDFTKLLESCGAMVLADRYCFGCLPRPGGDRRDARRQTAFDAVCRHYLHHNQCVRFMDGAKINQRHSELRRLAGLRRRRDASTRA